MPPSPSRRSPWWVGALTFPATWVFVAGALLRIWYWISARPLWLDEEMIALNIRDRALTALAGRLWLDQGAPLGWLAMQRMVADVFGTSEIALRAVPALFGVATLAVAWWVGKRWMSAAGAAVFVLLLSVGQWIFHFSLELKHYSADTFFALLLPALVVWALDAGDARGRLRRVGIWWVAAAAAEWCSMGGLLAAPACALVLGMLLWRRDGWRSAAVFTACGVGWLAIFGLHYALSLHFTANSESLRAIWADAMAPDAGPLDRILWLVRQAAPWADKPGGSGLPWLFWATAVAGFLLARPRVLGLVLATMPLSAAVLAIARVVPIADRLSIWALPGVYGGIALALDAGVRWARASYARRGWVRVAAGVAAAAAVGAVIPVCWNVARRASVDIPAAHPANSNHDLDDRAAVTWLAGQRRSGDAMMTTRLGEPAAWWYAGVPIDTPFRGGMMDGMPIFEITYHDPHPRCEDELAQALQPYSRALVYLGFRFDDVPKGFDDLLLRRLARLGHVDAVRQFAETSKAVIVTLAPLGDRPSGIVDDPPPPGALDGCLGVDPAARW